MDGGDNIKDGRRWAPHQGGAFQLYCSMSAAVASESSSESGAGRVVLRRPLVVRLTKDIVESFQLSNPNFKYLKPKRYLTNPSEGVRNGGCDNLNADLILHMDSVLVNMETKQRYHVKEILGQGTFGQVARCWVSETDSYVAVKIIKNSVAFHQQALAEVSILIMLDKKLGNNEKQHIVRILDYFVYQNHLCISFELLGPNLYELIKQKQHKGLPLSIVQMFSKQILQALVVIKEAGIIHCDLKPENILLSTSKDLEIKVIDFGSACMEGRTIYSYIQSRFYRSPEVVVGYPYNTAIDMWSFGCIVAELFLGLPIFSGASEFDLLKRMVEILGGQPPDHLLRNAKHIDKFFTHVGSIYHLDNAEACKGRSVYHILSEEEYEARRSEKPAMGRHYFNHLKLEDIIASYHYRRDLSEEEISREKLSRLALIDFLRGLLEFDPVKRWSPLQASRHPFVTGEPFKCPFRPAPETRGIPFMHNVAIDHNPGGGHLLAAGLSPQIQSFSRHVPHNSPRFPVGSMSHGNNFVNPSGSYTDNAGIGSSYGSYGDINSVYSYLSPVGGSCGSKLYTQVLGFSPDARHRSQVSLGKSSTGGLGPMSLGASPPQYTTSGSQMQISSGSPGKYVSTSPARGSFHGSPLGKATGTGHYNRRTNPGYHVASSMQPENPSLQWQSHHNDSISYSQPEGHSRGHFGSPRSTLPYSNQTNSRQRMVPIAINQSLPANNVLNSNMGFLHSVEVLSDKQESSSSLSSPADWDPNYSDDLLLQDDSPEVNSLTFQVSKNLRLNDATESSLPSGGVSQRHNHTHTASTFVPSNPSFDGQYQLYPHAQHNAYSSHDMRATYSRFPPISQNTTSRFGQQSIHGYNQHSNSTYSKQIYQNGQPIRSNFYAQAGSDSSSNATSGSGISWG